MFMKDLIVTLFRLVELRSHEFTDQPNETKRVPNYTYSTTPENSSTVGIDVHKKTIVL